MKTNDLVDIWRELNSNKRQFTWRRKDKSQASRIDYILVNKNFKSRINWCKIKPVCIKYTDHQSVFLNFLSSVEEKGKGFWKINNSILNDKDYQDKINDIILKYSAKINDLKNCRLLWDALKVEIREITMTFSKIKAKETRELMRTLEAKLACSDTAVIYNEILNNEIDKLEQIYEQHCMKFLLLRQPKGIGNVIFSLAFVVFYLHFEKNQKV